MTRLLAALALFAAPALAEPSVAPRRIVSLNLCADQLLLELADPVQIAGLTRNAVDPQMSAAAAKVGRIHIMRGAAEEALAIDPDLVVGMAGGAGGIVSILRGRSRTFLDLQPANRYADIRQQVRAVAAAVGHPARGEALVARMDRELAAIPRTRGGVAAYYQRRGFLTGSGTLIDELMTRLGLTNLATKLGKPPLSTLSLEELVAARPDYLIVDTDRVTDQGTEMVNHPILAHIAHVHMPEAWTVCGGPSYVLAARRLSEEISRSRR